MTRLHGSAAFGGRFFEPGPGGAFLVTGEREGHRGEPARHENAASRYTETTCGVYGRGRTRTYDLTDVNRAL